MAKSLTSLLLLLLAFISAWNPGCSTTAQKTWCVAKPSSDEKTLLENLNYACSEIDCRILQKDCPCFLPDTLINHASIAMNLYYHSKGRNYWNCDFKKSGLIVVTDPSYGSCLYE